MARGRMLNASLCDLPAFNRLSESAALLFVLMMLHLDRDGRMTGEIGSIRGKLVPNRRDFSDEKIARCLHELGLARTPDGAPFVVWYEVGDQRVIEVPSFVHHNPLGKDRKGKGSLYGREPASQFSPPPAGLAVARDPLQGDCMQDVGKLLTASMPNRSEVNTREEKESEAPPLDLLEAGFDQAWLAYPKREGGNSRKAAFLQFRARVRSGDATPADLVEAVKRYADYIRATKQEGTRFVMRGETFFGPNERWKDDFRAPAGTARRPNYADADAVNAATAERAGRTLARDSSL